MRATLSTVLTPDAWDRMIPLATRFRRGVEDALLEFGLSWHVTQLGCRAEYRFQAGPPRNGTEARCTSSARSSGPTAARSWWTGPP